MTGERGPHVWATPCLTYLLHLDNGRAEGWVGGCLYHQGRRGPARASEAQAQADCTQHLHAVWNGQAHLPTSV